LEVPVFGFSMENFSKWRRIRWPAEAALQAPIRRRRSGIDLLQAANQRLKTHGQAARMLVDKRREPRIVRLLKFAGILFEWCFRVP